MLDAYVILSFKYTFFSDPGATAGVCQSENEHIPEYKKYSLNHRASRLDEDATFERRSKLVVGHRQHIKVNVFKLRSKQIKYSIATELEL